MLPLVFIVLDVLDEMADFFSCATSFSVLGNVSGDRRVLAQVSCLNHVHFWINGILFCMLKKSPLALQPGGSRLRSLPSLYFHNTSSSIQCCQILRDLKLKPLSFLKPANISRQMIQFCKRQTEARLENVIICEAIPVNFSDKFMPFNKILLLLTRNAV